MQLRKVRRSGIDSNPPKEVKEKVEKSLSKMKSRTQDHVPIGFIGKGGKGYILKEMIRHRSWGAPSVNKDFKDAVRLTGTDKEH